MSLNIVDYIDHTILKAETTFADVQRICAEAVSASFFAVCIPPYYVKAAKNNLIGSKVKVATVIGFPMGYSSIASKRQEIEDAINDGADELDMVVNIAAIKNKDTDYLQEEIKTCLVPVKAHGKLIKLIVESGTLTQEELAFCCALYSNYPIDFMKTSTGYSAVGATIEAVATMRRLLPAHIAIKASGGIRTYDFAKTLIDAGATRIGCSAGLQILAESKMQEQ